MKRLIFAALAFVALAQPAFAVNFCYVTEFPLQVDGSVQVATTPAFADQQITVSVASASSAAFGSNTGLVRISCDTTVSAIFGAPGATPTAATTNMRLPANVPEYFRVRPTGKVAFITNQ